MKTFQFKFLAPLINFNYDEKELQITQNCLIRKITENENSIFNTITKEMPNIKYGDFLIDCSINKSKPEKEIGQHLTEGRENIEKVLTLLRLIREDIVGYNFIIQPYSKEDYGYRITHWKHYELWFNPPQDFKSGPYNLKKEEIGILEVLASNIIDQTYKKFSLSIEYFNKSYIEPYTPRDSLLDLMIALDSLYIRENQPELVYRLKMRIAHLLSNNFSDRKNITELIKNAYDIRSQIIHGKKKPKITYDFLFEIRNIVRNSIVIFLLNPEINKSLDDIIMGEEIKLKKATPN